MELHHRNTKSALDTFVNPITEQVARLKSPTKGGKKSFRKNRIEELENAINYHEHRSCLYNVQKCFMYRPCTFVVLVSAQGNSAAFEGKIKLSKNDISPKYGIVLDAVS